MGPSDGLVKGVTLGSLAGKTLSAAVRSPQNQRTQRHTAAYDRWAGVSWPSGRPSSVLRLTLGAFAARSAGASAAALLLGWAQTVRVAGRSPCVSPPPRRAQRPPGCQRHCWAAQAEGGRLLKTLEQSAVAGEGGSVASYILWGYITLCTEKREVHNSCWPRKNVKEPTDSAE